MSSDESTSTQFSTFSNKDENKAKFIPHKPEPWEINFIGNFLLDLYHRSLIGPNNDWCIKKFVMRKEFENIITEEIGNKLKDLNGTDHIGTLLHNCRFLINTPRGSNYYKIKYLALFDYRNTKLGELDDFKIKTDNVDPELINNDKRSKNDLMNLLRNKSNILTEVDEEVESLLLEYQRTASLKRKENYEPTNMSCCICQEDFTTMENYEGHIQKHSDETDFEFLNTMVQLPSSFFKITYRLCKNYFCFDIKTETKNLIIENIIIVQSRSFYYVNNRRVPLKCSPNGKDSFFVDSHLFTINVEQPIVLIFHHTDNKDNRIIEQHHFMRSENLPKVQLSVNPYRLPNERLFEPLFDLPDFFPPQEIQNALKDINQYHEKLMEISNDFRNYMRNGKILQPQNIAASLNILLQIEDMDTLLQYLSLTKKGVQLRSYGDLYSFRLKTKQNIFIENILSTDDEIILTTRTDTKEEDILKLMMQNKRDIELLNNTFVGKIHAINMEHISFKCDTTLNLKSQYTVICRPSRLNVRIQYRALETLSMTMSFLNKFLFPAKIIPRPVSNVEVFLYNWNINDEQLQAVRNIYEGPRNDATYIIFGPPGTGKTTTLVEGILQLLRKFDTKILVTASSDIACDEIAKRLCKYLKNIDIEHAIARIYSQSSKIRTETIDNELLDNSNIYNGHFYPDIDKLHEYRIVVCTLTVAGFLSTGKFGRSENGKKLYTHLIIDDVTAAMEVEALIGITTVLTPKSCLIISGDHKQLGPVLKSKRAEELGLGTSLMDRLMARDCYRIDVDTGNYDRTIQTRLIRNHRSHPAIVNLFSGLYYNHSLEAHANKADVSLCENWHKSRNKMYPIMFHAIYEPSKTDLQSHSLYNLSELNVVMDYVKDLMYFGINGIPVNENNIGIISPYKKQIKRIQEELNLRKWFDIETGSAETFQGKEKDIIIVSFVRSGTSNLGLLDNARHLNVTISRPKSCLILIGNPLTLSLNSDFEYIIKECKRNNTFVGSNAPKKGDLKKQVNLAKSQEQLSVLNKGLSTLKLDNSNLKKDVKTSNKTNDQKQLRAATTKKMETKTDQRNNEKSKGKKEERNIKKVEESSDDDDSEDDDDNEDESDSDSDDDDCDKPSTSTSTKNKFTSKKTSKKGKNKQALKNKSAGGKVGKVTKQYGKGKQKNVGDNKQELNKIKLDTFLDDLPKVPIKNFTNPKFLEMQQQDQTYNIIHPQHQQVQPQPPFQMQQQQPQPPFNNILPQQTSFQPYFNQPPVPYIQQVPTQHYPSTVVYTHHPSQPQPIYPYAMPGYMHTTPGMNTLPYAPINNVMSTNANLTQTKTEDKNKGKPKRENNSQNRNFRNNKNTSNTNENSKAKPNKASNSGRSTKKII